MAACMANLYSCYCHIHHFEQFPPSSYFRILILGSRSSSNWRSCQFGCSDSFESEREFEFSFIAVNHYKETINICFSSKDEIAHQINEAIYQYYNRKQKMGQNLRAVEQIVMNLQNQQIITPEQSECFLQDFQEQNQSLAPVHKFLDDRSLSDYLKYYILCNYNRQQKPRCGGNRHAHSRQEIEAVLIQATETEIKQRVIKEIKNIEQSVKLALRKVTGVVLTDRLSMGNWLIRKLLKDCLSITKFIIILQHQGQFLEYNSSTNHLLIVGPEHSKYDRLTETLSSCSQPIARFLPPDLPQCSGMDCTIIFSHEADTYYFVFENSADSALIEVIQRQTNLEHFKTVIVTEMRQILIKSTKADQSLSDRLLLVCSSSLIIIHLGVSLQEFRTTKYLLSLNQLENKKNDSIIETIQNLAHASKSCGTPFISQNSVILVRKHCEKIAALTKTIKDAIKLLNQDHNFLFFNRYSDLSFCFVDASNPLYKRLRSCWSQNRIKIMDILGEQQDVHDLIKSVIKSEGCKPSQIINQVFSASLEQNNKGVFETLTITFHKCIRVDKIVEQKDESISQSAQQEKKLKHETSELQARMVKDLEKQDPNLKTTGWLKLFVKQPLHNPQARSSKQEPKWIVTDIEKIEGIDSHDFNVLQLCEDQLVNWIWNIMNTNLFFNGLMKSEEAKVKFTNFIEQVKNLSTANKNIFHNFHHCVNTLHMCYLLTQNPKVQTYLSSLDVFAVLISGLCYCISHTGFTNAFEIASFSGLALTYNNISPLENSQAARIFQLLKDNKYNFLEPLDRSKFGALKQNVVHNILSTSASEHFKVLQNFKQWTLLPKDQAASQSNCLTAMIVCAGDFAGSCKQFEVSKEWSRRLNMQYANQMEEEKKLGITCGQLSVDMGCIKSWAQSKTSYLSVIVSPVYKEIFQFFPESSNLAQVYEALQRNIEQWSKYLAVGLEP